MNGDLGIGSVPWRTRLRFLPLAAVFVFCVAAVAKIAWDVRAESMSGPMARAIAAGEHERGITIAAIVTMLRENRRNAELLLELADHADPSVAEQARIALRHLRDQLR